VAFHPNAVRLALAGSFTHLICSETTRLTVPICGIRAAISDRSVVVYRVKTGHNDMILGLVADKFNPNLQKHGYPAVQPKLSSGVSVS